jgi:hypothetical protein
VLDGFNSIRAISKDRMNNVNTKQKRETYSKIASSKTLANANKKKIESLESLIKKGKIVDYLTDVSLWLVLLY